MAEHTDPVAGTAGDQTETAPPVAAVSLKPRRHWIEAIGRLNELAKVTTQKALPQRFVRSLAAADYFGVGKHEAQTDEAREAKAKLAMFDRWPAKLQRAFMDVFGIGKPEPGSKHDRTVELPPVALARLQRAAEKRTRRKVRNLTGAPIALQRDIAMHGISSDTLLAAWRGDKDARQAIVDVYNAA